MRTIAMAAAAAAWLAAGVPAARALSEWWTPSGKSCPTFDGEEACQQYCAADQSRCGGATQCDFHTGDERPDCATPVEK